MYKHLQSIAAFVAVAETGAFNRAAKKLGVKSSVISHHVAKLEDHIGATLIYRTTRKLTLSEQGRLLFEAAHGWMNGTQQALDRIIDVQEEAVGALHVALPAFVPDPQIERALMDFATLHPNVALSLNYSDEVVDLLEGDFDLGLRLGTPQSSSFLRRKLAEINHILVASPELITRHIMPKHPGDLPGIPNVTMNGKGEHISLTNNEETVLLSTQNSRIETNSIYGARASALSGLGFANLPLPLCEKALAEGSLIQLLPEWHLPKLTLQAIWPEKSRRNSLTKRLVDHMVREKSRYSDPIS